MTKTADPAWFFDALESLRVGNVDDYMSIYEDDAVHEFPFAPDAAPDRLDGKPAIWEYMRGVPAVVSIDSYDVTSVREAQNVLIIELTARGRVLDGSGPLHLPCVWFITHDHGRVVHFRDYMDPLRLPAADAVPALRR